jgi:hypothetical protein
MKNRKTEVKPSKEFERALAQCRPEDFDGHTEFYRLTPSSGSNGYARRRPSFTSSKAKRILTLGTDHASTTRAALPAGITP